MARTYLSQEERADVACDKDEEQKRIQVSCLSPQETSIPEELLVTVVKPGLPTIADLYVLLPPPRPTRKRSLTSDKVCPWPPEPRCPLHGRGGWLRA